VVLTGTTNVFSFNGRGELSPYVGGAENRVTLFNGHYTNIRIFAPQINTSAYPYIRDCEIVNTIDADSGSTDPLQLVDSYFTTTGGASFDFDCTNGVEFHISGGWNDIVVANLAAGQTLVYYGWGKLTLAASCTGGTVRYVSHVEVTDLASGAVTEDIVSTPDPDVAAIKAVTDVLPNAGALTDLSTQVSVDAVKTVVDLIVLDTNELQTDDIPTLIATAQADLDTITGADGAVLLSGTQTSIDAIKAVTDAANSIDGKTLQEALRIISAVVAGIITDADTATETFKGLDGVTDRAIITVDEDGNRTGVAYP